MQTDDRYIESDMGMMNKEESLKRLVFVDKNGSIMYY